MTTFHDRRDGDYVPMGPGSEYDAEARSCPKCLSSAIDAIQSGTLDHLYMGDFVRREHQKHSGEIPGIVPVFDLDAPTNGDLKPYGKDSMSDITITVKPKRNSSPKYPTR